MNKAVLLLRLSYWAAAITDFVVAVLVWMPERMGLSATVYPMGLASVIVFSWAVMLLIADRRPLQRRWILIPTILVVALIAAVRIVFSLEGAVEFSLLITLFAVALIALMAYSYHYSGKYDGRQV